MKNLILLTAVIGALVLGIVLSGCEKTVEGTDSNIVGPAEKVSVGDSDSECHTLYAGQNIDAGAVCYEDIDTDGVDGPDALKVCYTAKDCWEIREIHFAIGDDLKDIPVNRKGNPVPGQFPYKFTFGPGVTSHCFVIPFADFGYTCEGDPTIYVAAHAALVNPCTGGSETGWGEGDGFNSGNWAMYTTLNIDCETVCDDCPPKEGCETAFGFGETCFLNIDEDGDGKDDFNRWGWTFGPVGAGTYTQNIYAAAGQCDITKGTLVGTLTVEYNGSTATVTYAMNSGYTMDEAHLYVGSEILPRDVNGAYTVAPGQYPMVDGDLDGASTATYTVENLSGEVYVVAHAVVCGEGF